METTTLSSSMTEAVNNQALLQGPGSMDSDLMTLGELWIEFINDFSSVITWKFVKMYGGEKSDIERNFNPYIAEMREKLNKLQEGKYYLVTLSSFDNGQDRPYLLHPVSYWDGNVMLIENPFEAMRWMTFWRVLMNMGMMGDHQPFLHVTSISAEPAKGLTDPNNYRQTISLDSIRRDLGTALYDKIRLGYRGISRQEWHQKKEEALLLFVETKPQETCSVDSKSETNKI